MQDITKKSDKFVFGGHQAQFEHESLATKTTMTFSVYQPPQAGPRPVLWYLSGLTCTDQNVVTKGGFQRLASELGFLVVCPDTSPRGADIEGEDEDWDFGSGAGFYLDATAEPWSKNYRMESYILDELSDLVATNFPADMDQQGITGHSMGGHGALTMALKHPERFKSVSAFSPICAPSQVPWGKKAFSQYLAEESQWTEYDANSLVQAGERCSEILIDQGLADSFLEEQLSSELFAATCKENEQAIALRMHEHYDHSYFFIASFMDDHIRHHARHLGIS